jgi:hypothetical protein
MTGGLISPHPAPRRDGWVGKKKIPYETLRGLPFGHPPFLAFLAMAASLAGLFDLPPSLPSCEYHSRTAGGGSSFFFIVSPLIRPRHLDDGAGILFPSVQFSPSSKIVTTGAASSPARTMPTT